MEKLYIEKHLFFISPFEIPDPDLALSTIRSGAFPILHLGRIKNDAVKALDKLKGKTNEPFGICLVAELGINIPSNVSVIVAPFGMNVVAPEGVKLFYQVHSLAEAKEAEGSGAAGLIVKGNEGCGKVGTESSYILFQRVAREVQGIDMYVQGGIGVHTAAAIMALGARGVVMDSQLALFPECTAPGTLKKVLGKLNGNETRVIDNYRVLIRPNSPALPEKPSMQDIEPLLNGFDIAENIVPLGQDIALATDLAGRYKNLDRLVFALREAVRGHLLQAKKINPLRAGNALAKDLNIEFPIAQGPMTRVSDVPEFAQAVADAGALPFVALSLLKGTSALNLIQQTKKLAGEKTWGVGILGFASQELRDEQLAYIKQEKPPVVLIAGGRPAQAKALEQLGIKVFLHVPSVSLLDMYLKEGARNFVFEGRECGGHVGPLSSMVLWEKQIERLLAEDHPAEISVFFAGGIHDAFSAAFIAVMAAPLFAKGVKAGVLMGTSYIYTREAVETGAILSQFQEQALSHSDTILLETAPGHQTRCLYSPFTDFFNKEKEKLNSSGLDKKEVWATLEKLNVGRLRIAAKGLERRNDGLVKISTEEQLADGMYMIGQVASMHDKVISIADLHENVAVENFNYIQKAALPPLPEQGAKALNVAIVGMACIYPGAKNIEEYWLNIILGKDCVTEVPDERWNKELYYDPGSGSGDMSHSKWGGFIPATDFDPVAFGIPPQSLAAIDPSQLLSLLVARQALKDAGYQDGNFNGENVSVIIGAEGGNDLAGNYGFRSLFKQVFGEMPQDVDDALPKLTEDSFPGVLANVISGRITNRLNLGGRNYTVDAACASSLAAIDLACQELYLNKSDMVLAGGVDLHNGINDYLMFSSTHALSRKGRCATFDAEADGIALGEGVAMVVLKRLEDARRDGDTIYAVIKGMGGSSDGKSLGLTAPRKSGQTSALARAYAQAGTSPAAAGLVEAHGTGTVVGDKTELSALTDMWLQSGALAGQTHLGSVKTQIGHTKCAAGMAGIIKSALAVFHGVKPPTLHLSNPNTYYEPATSPFAFNARAGIWSSEKRVAGISAFGFGGTNFHMVIENDPAAAPGQSALRAWPSELFVFRGDNPDEARRLLRSVQSIIQLNDTISLKDIAWSLAAYNQKPVQFSIISSDVPELTEGIKKALSGSAGENTFITEKTEGKVAFLFPGQGSQRINMARDLFVAFPGMRQLIGKRNDYEKILFPDAVFEEAEKLCQKEEIKATQFAQPLLGIVDLALANLLRSLGIVPDMVAGHSYGELPALCFAGAFAPELLISLSEKRAEAILNAIGDDKGSMLAISGTKEALSALLENEKEIWPVNFNSPRQSVLAGTSPAMLKLMERLQTEKISFRQLDVACAFHSPLLAGSKKNYAEAIKDIAFGEVSIPVWSNTTAAAYPVSPDAIRERLAEHLVKPVKFTEEIENMYAEGARIFIETGPGNVLCGLTRAILDKKVIALQTEDQDKEGITFLLHLIAAYLATGRTVRLEKLFEGRNVSLIDLDHPGLHKKSPTVWFVNGQHAVPSVGKLPAHGALPITQPLTLNTAMSSTADHNSTAADQMMLEYLGSMKTLIQAQRDVMLGYFGHTPQLTGPAPYITDSTSRSQPVPVQQIPGISPKIVPTDIKSLLLQIVSDKTGYPAEMLGLDMDMEADLSIDSIKRMEIIGELRTRLEGLNNGDEESMMEQLAVIKTLQGLISWISANQENNTMPVIQVQAAGVSRMRFEFAPSTAEHTTAGLIQGQHFAITDDKGNIAIAIKELLEEKGACADIITPDRDLDGYDGLIMLNTHDSSAHYSIMDAFAMIKKLNHEKVKWIYAFSDIMGHLDERKGMEMLRRIQGYPGLLKSLDRELEQTKCRMVSLQSMIQPKEFSTLVLNELLNADTPAEVFYRGTERHLFNLVPSELLVNEQSDCMVLDKEAVVLVLGGAQGITAELTSRFSKDYPCLYILVGRSKYPDEGHSNKYFPFKTKDEIRQELIKEGLVKSPAEIEKKVERLHKDNQIIDTISALEKNGASVVYQSLDLRDEAALRDFIRNIYTRYGRIDGLIHGAGLLEDKLFLDKTSESFERVFTTKVTPLRVLTEELRTDVKFVIFFSSIASVYGNRGQTDYAAANSVMDRYTWALKKKINGKVTTINWGPWKGTGMVSPSLEKEYDKRGIGMIPLQEGTESFVNELKYGNESQVLIMAGDTW